VSNVLDQQSTGLLPCNGTISAGSWLKNRVELTGGGSGKTADRSREQRGFQVGSAQTTSRFA
jgi:hypothetical protein